MSQVSASDTRGYTIYTTLACTSAYIHTPVVSAYLAETEGKLAPTCMRAESTGKGYTCACVCVFVYTYGGKRFSSPHRYHILRVTMRLIVGDYWTAGAYLRKWSHEWSAAARRRYHDASSVYVRTIGLRNARNGGVIAGFQCSRRGGKRHFDLNSGASPSSSPRRIGKTQERFISELAAQQLYGRIFVYCSKSKNKQ